MTAVCPACAETKLKPVHSTLPDTLLELMGIHHYRCPFCRRNTYTAAPLAHISQPEKPSASLHHA
ncbi:hypothetical protein AciX9_3611 [Granulicella tundricola MP5ACTX9]|uniref:Uncharacterized protein n=1 Tax=Granulicella tundricola (strain ATCC BAA-1859 / DSM 23138 / MP5ACTX9) TaxID=1198114 RepID=E8X5I7_GRATM|nr:hypothetical protein AciX9_3611 [Granulicella tundricola MP5ACTX9]